LVDSNQALKWALCFIAISVVAHKGIDLINRHSCTGFIFDVDATLVNTTLVINNIWKEWAGQNGVDFSIVYPHVHGRKICETLKLVGSQNANANQENVVNRIEIKAIKSDI
jgi:sugar-phosphatase